MCFPLHQLQSHSRLQRLDNPDSCKEIETSGGCYLGVHFNVSTLCYQWEEENVHKSYKYVAKIFYACDLIGLRSQSINSTLRMVQQSTVQPFSRTLPIRRLRKVPIPSTSQSHWTEPHLFFEKVQFQTKTEVRALCPHQQPSRHKK